jgi:hypothetical protein
MSRDHNTYEKRRREVEKRRKAEDKRVRRRKKKEQTTDRVEPDRDMSSDSSPSLALALEMPAATSR